MGTWYADLDTSQPETDVVMLEYVGVAGIVGMGFLQMAGPAFS